LPFEATFLLIYKIGGHGQPISLPLGAILACSSISQPEIDMPPIAAMLAAGIQPETIGIFGVLIWTQLWPKPVAAERRSLNDFS
jgi:hypothetical protein